MSLNSPRIGETVTIIRVVLHRVSRWQPPHLPIITPKAVGLHISILSYLSVKTCVCHTDAVCREHEPDLLMYEYYFNESETEVIILETFKGNEEIINHGNNTRSHPNVFNAFFEAIEIKSVDFLGPVSEEIMSGWVNFNPTAYKHHDGFTQ